MRPRLRRCCPGIRRCSRVQPQPRCIGTTPQQQVTLGPVTDFEFIVPLNVTQVLITLVGGGGGGGASGTDPGGGAGGAGGFLTAAFQVRCRGSGEQERTIVGSIGAAGSGGTTGAGTLGGNTFITFQGITVTGFGGQPGGAPTGPLTPGDGGFGGVGATTNPDVIQTCILGQGRNGENGIGGLGGSQTASAFFSTPGGAGFGGAGGSAAGPGPNPGFDGGPGAVCISYLIPAV